MEGRLIKTYGVVMLGGVVVLGLALVVLLVGNPLDDLIRLAEWIRAQGSWGWGVLLVLQMLVCVLGVLPASLLVMVAGSLYGLWYGFLLASTATLLGAVCAFLAGRFLVGPFLKGWVGKHFPLKRANEAIVAGKWKFLPYKDSLFITLVVK